MRLHLRLLAVAHLTGSIWSYDCLGPHSEVNWSIHPDGRAYHLYHQPASLTEPPPCASNFQNGDVLQEANGVPLTQQNLQGVINQLFASPDSPPGRWMFPLVSTAPVNASSRISQQQAPIIFPLKGFLDIRFVPMSDLTRLGLQDSHPRRDSSDTPVADTRQSNEADGSGGVNGKPDAASELMRLNQQRRLNEKSGTVGDQSHVPKGGTTPPPVVEAVSSEPTTASEEEEVDLGGDTGVEVLTPAQQVEKRRVQRSGGGNFTYTVLVDEYDPVVVANQYSIGLGFQPGPSGSVVNNVKPNSVASKFDVRVGDILLQVNEINVTGLQLPIVLRAIAVAAWPKTLTFKVESSKGVEAEAGESEGGNSGGSEAHVVLRIRSPEAFRGEYPITLSAWTDDWARKGDGSGGDECEEVTLRVMDPLHGCQAKDMSFIPTGGGGDDGGTVVVSSRGVCSFSDKARSLETFADKHSDYNVVGGLVVNSDNEAIRMPAVRTGGLSLPFAMIAHQPGHHLAQAISWSGGWTSGLSVKGWVGTASRCTHLSPQPQPATPSTPLRPHNKLGGRVAVLSSTGQELGPYEYRQALYGASPFVGSNTKRTVDMVRAEPPDGCVAQASKVRVKGKFVVVERGGGCLFFDKVKAAFELKAEGIIIANMNSARPSDLLSIPLGPHDKPSAEMNRMFSVLMVSKQFGVDLAALDGGVSFVGTIQGERHMGFSYK